jgi:hypothetical protein
MDKNVDMLAAAKKDVQAVAAKGAKVGSCTLPTPSHSEHPHTEHLPIPYSLHTIHALHTSPSAAKKDVQAVAAKGAKV